MKPFVWLCVVCTVFAVGCSPYTMPLKQSYLSQKAPVEWVRDMKLTQEEREKLNMRPSLRIARDLLGHTYEATDYGLRICAPQREKKSARPFRIKFAQAVLGVISPIAKFFGSDAFARIALGADGCAILDGDDGLPYEKLSFVVLSPAREDILLGTERGVILLRHGKFTYFAGKRWLPDDYVVWAAFLPKKDGFVVTTKTGSSVIRKSAISFDQKAKLFSEIMRARHMRGGFAVTSKNGIPRVSDNDGLWTALYVAAESFRYATTKSDNAHQNAKESLEALFFLESVTGVPGFFARAAVRKDEGASHDLHDGVWHASTIYPGWLWKGDTSFDELVGHFFAHAVYYDFVANDLDRVKIAAIVSRIVDRMIAHKLNLVGEDGNTTTWGRGSPDYTQDEMREFLGRGPISLTTLAIVKIAAHITKRDDLTALYQKLIVEYGYALNMLNAKIILPFGGINHSDDELAFLSYYNLVRLEKNPDLRRLYLLSLDRYWHIERSERNPLWNFIYCAVSENMCDTDSAVQILREFPTNLRNWRMENSQRADITLNGRDRGGNLQSKEVLPLSDRAVGRWNRNPYALDMGGDGTTEEDPTTWLLPYWLGKYHKLF